MGVGVDCADEVTRQPLFRRERLDRSARQTTQPLAARADPETPGRILGQRRDESRRDSVGRAMRGEYAILEAHQAAFVRPHPNPARAVFTQRHHRFITLRPRQVELIEICSSLPEQSTVPCAQPQGAITRREHRGKAFVVEQIAQFRSGKVHLPVWCRRRRRCGFPVTAHTQAAAIRSQPHRTLCVLGQRQHDVVREPIGCGHKP